MTRALGIADAIRAPPDRGAAFRAAGRHSGRVRWLKRGIVLASLGGIVALAGISFFDPFHRLPVDFSVASTSFNGGRITMEKPRMSGYRDDGKPFDLRAASGVQDVRSPNLIELSDLDGKIDTAEQSNIHLVAPRGLFDSAKNTMTLDGDVRITSGSGYDIRLRDARVDFKAGTVASDEPLTVVMTSGAIAANAVRISEHGRRIRFDGGVETTFKPAGAPGEEGGE